MSLSKKYAGQLKDVAGQAKNYYEKAIDPLARQLMFSRAPDPGSRRGHPLVLLIGNHSSGKSTLINYILGEEVQHTGVAPTDDSFTVITHGSVSGTKDGDALVSNPDLGFAELRKFGPDLVSHLKLKIRDSEFLSGLTLIDSPGMIDSAHSSVNRGYDFTEVVRWFAEQADVVLLLFDPDKPGTTGETLSVMRKALGEVSHKLLLVLNKMDQFRTLHDFARAYGALCWNLSKVIPTKDVPLIYNIYIPGPWVQEKTALPITDFDNARDQVLEEVKRAPLRRVDNILTRLYDNARNLHAHTLVSNEAGKLYRKARLPWWIGIGASALIGIVLAALLYSTVGPPAVMVSLAIGGGGLLLALILYLISRKVMRNRGEEILEGLTGIFERLYNDQYVLGDEADLNALWFRIKDRTHKAIRTIGFANLPKIKKKTLHELDNIFKDVVPKLRAELHESQSGKG